MIFISELIALLHTSPRYPVSPELHPRILEVINLEGTSMLNGFSHCCTFVLMTFHKHKKPMSTKYLKTSGGSRGYERLQRSDAAAADPPTSQPTQALHQCPTLSAA